MTQHLGPEEFVEALDGRLTADRRGHLDACEVCRADVEELRSIGLEAADVPAFEPSPLFWDHFNARVHGATKDLSVAPQRWWQLDWRPVAALATAGAALALVLTLRPGSVTPTETAPLPGIEDDGSWQIMLGMASEVSWETVREAVVPSAGTADAAIEELNAAQREELVRLLKKEIGEP